MAGIVALLTLLLAAPRGNAQTVPAANPEAPPGKTPSIVVRADEVNVDMVVHNKKNEAVLDLKPGDIAITDSGSAVTLSNLHLVTGQSAAQHQITMVFGRLEPSASKNARDIATKILKRDPAKQY